MTYFNAVKYISSRIGRQPNNSEVFFSLLERLGNPHRRMKYIRLAGSNGKTVCAEMLMSILTKAGYSIGCLRMPPREDPKENVCIGGKPISMEEFSHYTSLVKQAAINKEQENFIEPTGAEALLAVALLAFYNNKCNLCIIESDHFGEDPSKHLPPPFSAVICGTIPNNNTAAISRIRSYICKGISEIVSAPQDSRAYGIISDTCYSVNCRLTLPMRTSLEFGKLTMRGTEFTYKDKSYTLRLCGKFQVQNAILALEVIEMLIRKGFAVSERAISEGLSCLSIPAKFEFISIIPPILVDSTHTPVATDTVCQALTDFPSLNGTKVRLCLPSDAIAQNYINMLEKYGYSIEKIIAPDGVTLSDKKYELCLGKGKKSLVKQMLDDLNGNTLLILSGDYAFVHPLRYELLATLGYK